MKLYLDIDYLILRILIPAIALVGPRRVTSSAERATFRDGALDTIAASARTVGNEQV
jgi:hypothetical protein